MALTKVSRGLLSTSIDDNGNATAITIDSSENVGIGVTNPSDYYASWNNLVVGDTSGSAGMSIVTGTSNEGTIAFADGTSGDAQYKGYIQYNQGVDRLVIGVNGTEKMRIDSSGNVGIGMTPSARLSIRPSGSGSEDSHFGFGANRDTYISTSSTGTIIFRNASESMRIDASGNLLVGTSSTSVTNAHGIQMLMQVGATKPRLNIATSGYTSADYPLSLWSTAVSAWRFYVQADGRISAVYTAINSLSDERVKENIRDLDDGLSKVMQLQPRKFDWKEGKGKNITNDRGFIAQEFEQVFPDLVSEWKDEAPEGEEPYKSVSADLIPTLVKAIQEQQTLIESLTARIAALEE